MYVKILSVAAAAVKLDKDGMCQVEEPGYVAHIRHELYRLKPGNANLPIGGLQNAIQENGVPGKTSHAKNRYAVSICARCNRSE
jgi:hypothetical protein